MKWLFRRIVSTSLFFTASTVPVKLLFLGEDMIANLLERSSNGSWTVPNDSLFERFDDLFKVHVDKFESAFERLLESVGADPFRKEVVCSLRGRLNVLKESLTPFRHPAIEEISRAALLNQLAGIVAAVQQLNRETPLSTELQELGQVLGESSTSTSTSTVPLLDAKDALNRTPLHWAACHGQADLAKFLISKGAKVDAADDHGMEPLHLASEKANKEIIGLLIERGANVNAAADDGMRPLHGAARDGQKEVVEILLNNGANACAILSDGCHPLHWATVNGHKDIVELLIHRGAAIHAADKFGMQPLHIAAINGDAEMVELLLSKGANAFGSDTNKKRPLDLSSNHEIKKLLLRAQSLEPLLSVYRNQGYLTRFLDKKPFPIEGSYINVALFDQGDSETVEFANNKDPRNSRDVQSRAREIKLSELFDGNTRLYVEGAAGSGKTTLCRYLVSSWAQSTPKRRQEVLGVWANSYEAILLLPLREIRSLSLNATINDFILKRYPTLSVDLFDPNKTLYILDGYDEIASLEELCSNNEEDRRWNIVETLLRQPQWIITSRPNLFCERFYGCRRLQNSGFTNENVIAYVKRFTADFNIQSEGLERAITSQRELQVLASNPLYLELVCSLWRENPGVLHSLNNLSTLYDKIVALLFRRHLMRIGVNTKALFLREVLAHEKVSPYRECLEEIAFYSKQFGGNRIIPTLYQPLLQKIPMEEREVFGKSLFDQLGFLTPVGEAKELLEQSYSFVHLTFEEYFAARYVVARLESPLPLLGSKSAADWLTENCFSSNFERLIDFIASLALSDYQLNTFVNALPPNGREFACELRYPEFACEWTYSLHRAVYLGLLKLTDLLIKKGEKIDGDHKYGNQPLHFASENGHKEIVELLLSKGAKIHAAENGGKQPLHFASENGHKEIVELLLSKEAKIDAADNTGKQPLHYAAERGHKLIVMLLLGKGAKIDAADNNGKQPLHYAAEGGHKLIVMLLLGKGAKIDAADNYGKQSLHFASEKGHKEVVEQLLGKGAKIEAANNNGEQPLHWAAERGHEEVVELLLSKGAKICAANIFGNQPLHFAAQSGREEVVELLLTKGAKIDAASNKGMQPLHYAAFWNRKEVVELLLTRGAKIDAADDKGKQPLHYAAENGGLDLVKLLLQAGSKLHAVYSDGTQPVHFAARNMRIAVLDLILDWGAKIDAVNRRQPLHYAVKKGYLPAVELLLQRGAKVDATDSFGRQPLHWAALHCHTSVVKLLLQQGADAFATDNDGNRPLELAAVKRDRRRVVPILLSWMNKEAE